MNENDYETFIGINFFAKPLRPGSHMVKVLSDSGVRLVLVKSSLLKDKDQRANALLVPSLCQWLVKSNSSSKQNSPWQQGVDCLLQESFLRIRTDFSLNFSTLLLMRMLSSLEVCQDVNYKSLMCLFLFYLRFYDQLSFQECSPQNKTWLSLAIATQAGVKLLKFLGFWAEESQCMKCLSKDYEGMGWMKDMGFLCSKCFDFQESKQKKESNTIFFSWQQWNLLYKLSTSRNIKDIPVIVKGYHQDELLGLSKKLLEVLSYVL